MAYQVQKGASGNAPNTGMPKNKPPVRQRFDQLTGVFGAPLPGKTHDGAYGQNRYGGASSTTPGQTVESPMATDLRTTAAQGADGGDVLATVQKFGAAAMRNPLPGDDVEDVRGTPATQLRDIAAKACPDSYGMESARARQASSYPGAAGTIPGALQDDAAQPARKPA
jgi:hypothetical protein